MTLSRTICLGFIAVIFTGALLLMMPFSTSTGEWNDPIVALFTSTSAVCVTGLAVVDTGKDFSFWGQLFIALLAQIGGLGYMTTTTFLILLIGRKFDLRHKLAIQDSFDRPLLQGSRNIIRSVIATTLLFELTGIFLLMTVFVKDFGFYQGLWMSVFHSVSAWNNAGFGLLSDNLVQYRSSVIVNLTITGLIIFGGIGYQVIIEFYVWLVTFFKRKKAKYIFSLNFKVATSTTILLLIVGTILIFFTELKNPETLQPLSNFDKIMAAWFQSVTSRTAGFNTIDIGKMTYAGLFITIALMFIGASPSGTGGGIKTTTFRIIGNCTSSILQGKDEVTIYGRTVPNLLILKAISVVFGSAVVIVLATISLSLSEPEDKFEFVQLFFEVVSAFGTVGLSTGITAALSAGAKLTLVGVMYVGRVGILLLMSAILGDPRPTMLRYPEENLLVG
ncbi:TrkH family potassium uptake protein [Oscillatoria sp. FACHB-1406]|uniref:TrkH family potassium uptake protein n=1 Tax=Oscillatoria sp. FACHB-1406 TaxID=2692846 RepID=UPI0016855085|nr:TrkH family potassium uptake protein [Oscillatoria sp. FACHB-1406]MBD2576975.1 ATPase [Oscillatoria sp. FACHB-1406]